MNNDFRVRFGKTTNGKRQAALVTIKKGDHVFFGISKCHSKKDTFDKQLAIEIAYGRAHKTMSEIANPGSDIVLLYGNQGVVPVNIVAEVVEYFYKFTKSHRSKQ